MEQLNSQTKEQRDAIIEALGGIPVPPTQSDKKANKILPIFVISFVLIIIFLALVIVSNNGLKSNNIQNNVTVENETLIGDSLGLGLETISSFTNAIANKETGSILNQYIDENSMLLKLGVTIDVLEDVVGPGLNWSSCRFSEVESYRNVKYDYNGQELDSVYVMVECQGSQDENRMLEFDMRKQLNNQRKIFDIVVRN